MWYRVDDTKFNFRHLELEGLQDILVELNCRPRICSLHVGWRYRFGSHQYIGMVTEAVEVDVITFVSRTY